MNGDTTFVIPEVKVRVSKIKFQVLTRSREGLTEGAFKGIDFDEVKEIVVDSEGSKRFFGTVYYTDRGRKYISAKSPLIVFEYHLSDILTKFALLILQCPECKTIFLASRKNKQFCSVRCQSRLNMRKYRGTPLERVGKRGRPPGTGRKKEGLLNVKGGSSHGKTKLKG